MESKLETAVYEYMRRKKNGSSSEKEFTVSVKEFKELNPNFREDEIQAVFFEKMVKIFMVEKQEEFKNWICDGLDIKENIKIRRKPLKIIY